MTNAPADRPTGRLVWTNLVGLAGQTPASTFPLEAG
jgi:hypothetical protein